VSGAPRATGCQKLRDPVQKTQGKGEKLTKGSWWPEPQRKMVDDDGRAAEAVGFSRTGYSRGARGSLVARIDLGSPCGGNQGVKVDRKTSAATDWRGGADHRRRLRGKFSMMHRLGAQLLGSESFWMARGSGRGGCGGLGHAGAAARRRGREGVTP
jgi:hypothetical protein